MNTQQYRLRHSFSSTGRYLGAKKVKIPTERWKHAIACLGVGMAIFVVTVVLCLAGNQSGGPHSRSHASSIQDVVGLGVP